MASLEYTVMHGIAKDKIPPLGQEEDYRSAAAWKALRYAFGFSCARFPLFSFTPLGLLNSYSLCVLVAADGFMERPVCLLQLQDTPY